MKTILTVLLLAFLLISCQKNIDDCDQKNEASYQFVDPMNKTLTPYFRDAKLDYIEYQKNNGDTVHFNLTAMDSLWYVVIDNRNPNCINKRQDWYQIFHKIYINETTGDKFEIFQSLFKKIDQLPKYGGPFEMYNSFEFYFNEYHYVLNDEIFANPKPSKNYVGTLQIGPVTYNDVVYASNNVLDSNSSIAYFNKEFGLLKLVDKKNNVTWTISKK
jgi:hypothetical protein